MPHDRYPVFSCEVVWPGKQWEKDGDISAKVRPKAKEFMPLKADVKGLISLWGKPDTDYGNRLLGLKKKQTVALVERPMGTTDDGSPKVQYRLVHFDSIITAQFSGGGKRSNGNGSAKAAQPELTPDQKRDALLNEINYRSEIMVACFAGVFGAIDSAGIDPEDIGNELAEKMAAKVFMSLEKAGKF